FFFSSRSRHTSFSRDWSSDVCSSDLQISRYRDIWLANFLTVEERGVHGWRGWPYAYVIPRQQRDTVGLATLLGILHRGQVEIRKIRRASGRAGARPEVGGDCVET